MFLYESNFPAEKCRQDRRQWCENMEETSTAIKVTLFFQCSSCSESPNCPCGAVVQLFRCSAACRGTHPSRTAASEFVCSKDLARTAPCYRWLQIEACSKAAWASIFVPFHFLAKSWTQDYFFRCQQYPVIIPLLTYNCFVAESLPSQQLWAQRWRHLFTQTEVWEQINSRFGKGQGGRERLILNMSLSGPKAGKTFQENAPHHPAMLFEMDLSRPHSGDSELTNKKIMNSTKAPGLHLIIVCCQSVSD